MPQTSCESRIFSTFLGLLDHTALELSPRLRQQEDQSSGQLSDWMEGASGAMEILAWPASPQGLPCGEGACGGSGADSQGPIPSWVTQLPKHVVFPTGLQC